MLCELWKWQYNSPARHWGAINTLQIPFGCYLLKGKAMLVQKSNVRPCNLIDIWHCKDHLAIRYYQSNLKQSN